MSAERRPERGGVVTGEVHTSVSDKAATSAAAHEYRRRGWSVVPVHSGAKRPIGLGWQDVADMSGADIHAFWEDHPGANVGIRTGARSGLVVLDADGPEGLASLAALDPPLTYTVRTPSGGLHAYFRLPHGVRVPNSVRKLGPGLDVRGDGGQVVAPPSRTSAGTYVVEHDVPVAGLPDRLLDKLRPAEPAPAPAATPPPPPRYVAAGVDGELARLDECQRRATPGGHGYAGPPWDATTYGVACNLLELSNGSGGTYAREQAHADFLAHAPSDDRFGPREHEAKWTSALRTVGDKARTAPDPFGTAALPGTPSAAQEMVSDVRRRYPPLDLAAVLSADYGEPDWQCEPLLERGTSVALYSPPKAGKSMLLQEIAAALAAGHGVLGNSARSPERVLYVDAENTARDIGERLTAMGYAANDFGDGLIYLSFAALPPLDTPTGAAELLDVVDEYRPALVVLDTVSRFVEGDENDAATYANLYRLALAPLKARNVTVARLDHAGKDATKGQRGSSAKSADVDAVWRLTADGDRVELVREVSRNGHGDERLSLTRQVSPLRHVPRYDDSPFGRRTADVAQVVADLDALGLPDDAGRPAAQEALTKAGRGRRNDLVTKAVKIRKDRPKLSPPAGDSPLLYDSSTAVPIRGDSSGETAGQRCPGPLGDSRGQVSSLIPDRTVPALRSIRAGQAGTAGEDSGTAGTVVGPCARCGTSTRRYGDAGSPLCDACSVGAS